MLTRAHFCIIFFFAHSRMLTTTRLCPPPPNLNPTCLCRACCDVFGHAKLDLIGSPTKPFWASADGEKFSGAKTIGLEVIEPAVACVYYRNPEHPPTTLHTTAELPGTVWPQARLGGKRQQRAGKRGSGAGDAEAESHDAGASIATVDADAMVSDESATVSATAAAAAAAGASALLMPSAFAIGAKMATATALVTRTGAVVAAAVVHGGGGGGSGAAAVASAATVVSSSPVVKKKRWGSSGKRPFAS
jgi:hypothetical protein